MVYYVLLIIVQLELSSVCKCEIQSTVGLFKHTVNIKQVDVKATWAHTFRSLKRTVIVKSRIYNRLQVCIREQREEFMIVLHVVWNG